MSPNVAGVTLLALGNGSPDIFSTIASVQQNEIGQALGSLLGGGMFVTTVVVGSVALASKSVVPKVTRRPFLRDIGFYIVSLVTIFFICWDGKVRIWESILFILFYAIYVVVIVVGRVIYQKRKKARIAKLSMASVAAFEADQDEFEFVGSGTGGKSYDDYDEHDSDPNALTGARTTLAEDQNVATRLASELLQQSTSFGAQTLPHPSSHASSSSSHGSRSKMDGQQTIKERMAKRMNALGVYISKVGFWRNKTKSELKREVRMTLAAKADPHNHHRRAAATLRQTVQRISDIAIPEDYTDETSDSSYFSSDTEAPAHRTVGWDVGSIVNQQLISANNEMEDEDEDDELIAASTIHHHHQHHQQHHPTHHNTSRHTAYGHGPAPTLSGLGGVVGGLVINDDAPVSTIGSHYDEDNVPLLMDGDLDDLQEADYAWDDNIDDSTWKGAVKLNWRNFKDIVDWDDGMKNWRSKIFLFADMPRLLLQHLSVHFAEPDTYFRPFYVLQPLGIAIFLLSCFGAWDLHTKLPGPFGVWMLPIALALCAAVYFTTKNDEPPVYEWLFIVVGMFMSVLWIYFTAQELVALLGATGKILRISNAIMGLTVLAWGNSIGDMVSNVVVSRKGFPQMALSACYASPLCTMLLGLGIALTMRIAKLRVVSFNIVSQLSNTVFWGFIFLIGSLVFVAIIVPVSGFTFKKILGITLIAIYGVFTLLSLLTEFNLIFKKSFVIWDQWPGRS